MTVHMAETVKNNVERPFGDDARVQLLERTGGGIPRVGKKLLAGRLALGIELLKSGLG
jgi:hypothetical protein